MRTYSVWIEGYSATGDSARASYVGTTEADNFVDACRYFFIKELAYFKESPWPSFWGCRPYDNEKSARKQFG